MFFSVMSRPNSIYRWALFDDTMFLQVGFYVGPMQDDMYRNHDQEYQCSPFMQNNKKMPERSQETASNFISSGQYKPIQKTGTAQENEEAKGHYIDYPKF
jgi:hypothetical protein